MVDEHLAVKMVELMLHDTGQIALHPLVVLLELLVLPLHVDACGTHHLLVDGRQRQTAFLAGVSLRLVALDDVRIDIHLTETLVLGQIVAQHIEVDNRQTDGAPYLGGCQSDAFALGQRLPHIANELLQLWIVGGNVFGHLAEHRLAIYINR